MINVRYNILKEELFIDGLTGVSISEDKNEIEIDSIMVRYINGLWGTTTNVHDDIPKSFIIGRGYSYLKSKNYKKILKAMETYFKNFDISYDIKIEPSRYTLKKGKKHDRD